MEKDYILDITDLLPEYAPNLYARYSDEELEMVSYDGKLMAIPSRQKSTNRLCAVIREDLAEKYEIEDINTFEDYERFMSLIKEKEPDITPGVIPPDSTLFMQKDGYISLYGSIVYKYGDPEMKLVPWERTDSFKEAFITLGDWRSKKYLRTDNSVVLTMSLGRLASFVWDWDTAKKYIRDIGNGSKLKIFPLYEDKPAFRSAYPVASIVINKNSQNPEKVLRFLDWVYSTQENYDLFMYGIKGENYTLDGNKVKLPEKNAYYGWYGYDAFVCDEYDRSLTTDPAGYYELCRYIEDLNVVYPPTLGFKIFYGEKERKILNDRESFKYCYSWEDKDSGTMYSGISVVDEKLRKLEDLDKIFESINFSQKISGIDELLAYQTRKLDEWKAG